MAERRTECTVCVHPKVTEIDAALLGGTTIGKVAETFGPSRSAVGRHKLSHMTAEAAQQLPDGVRGPLTIVDVHGDLTRLADRLEKVLAAAAQQRKPAFVSASARELRATLDTIAKLQADPDLKAAATAQEFQKIITSGAAHTMIEIVEFVMTTAGIRDAVWHQLWADCLRVEIADDGHVDYERSVDTAPAKAFLDRKLLAEADRVEAEVRRRVVEELERRDAEAAAAREPRALTGRPLLAIEAG